MFRMLRHLSVYVAVSVILSTTGYIVFPLQAPGWPWRLSQALHSIVFGAVFGMFSIVFHLFRGRNYMYEPYIYHILDWNRPLR